MLSEEHYAYLAARGITDPDIIDARGYETVEKGLKIPVWGLVEEAPVGHEIRLDNPVAKQKFTRPQGQGNRLNVAPVAIPKILQPTEPLWLVEGTTRADALAQRGVAAASITGVWGWKSKESGALSDFHGMPWHTRTVIFGPDADAWSNPKVNKAVREFITFAERKGAKVSVLRLPEGQGIDDYLAAGHSAMSLYSLAVQASEVPVILQAPGYDFASTDDLTLATRWAEEHPHARYLTDTSTWVVWDGRKWVEDTKSGAITRQSILKTVRTVVGEIFAQSEDAKSKALAGKIRQELYSAGKTANIRFQAETLHEVQATEDSFDSNPYLLNLSNGTLDLRTRDLHPHEPHRMQRAIAPVIWDTSKPGVRWQQFLDEILPREIQTWVQAFLGSSLVNQPAEQILPIFQGSGANGKSVLVGAIQAVLGSDYTAPIDKKLLLAGKREDHQTNLMALKGKRLVTASETDAGDKLALASVKQLTGGDLITARGIGKDQTSFRPTHNLLMLTNSRPEIDGADKAIWRRLKIVPFLNVIPEERQDRGLERHLIEEEGSAILKWLVNGFHIWWDNDHRLPESHIIEMHTMGYQMDENSFAAFQNECLVVDPKGKVVKGALAAAWTEWQMKNGDAKKLSSREFNEAIRNLGCTERVTRVSGEKSAVRVWEGISLIEDKGLKSYNYVTEKLQESYNLNLENPQVKGTFSQKATEATAFSGIALRKNDSDDSSPVVSDTQKAVASVASVASAGQSPVVDLASCNKPVAQPVTPMFDPATVLLSNKKNTIGKADGLGFHTVDWICEDCGSLCRPLEFSRNLRVCPVCHSDNFV